MMELSLMLSGQLGHNDLPYVLAVVGRSLAEILLKDTHAEKSHNYCRSQGAAKYQDSSPDQSG